MNLDNPNPEVFERLERQRPPKAEGEPLDAGDVFEFIRDIQDPEHPYSLEQLNVVKEELISLDHDRKICTCVPCVQLPRPCNGNAHGRLDVKLSQAHTTAHGLAGSNSRPP
jgi:hypothetical protein